MSRRVPKNVEPEVSSEEEEEEDEDEEVEEVDPIEKIKALPLEQRRRVYGLKALLKATRALQRDKKDKIARIEESYLAKMQPLFELRRKIIAGEHEPTAEEIKAGEKPEESKIEEIPSSDDEDDKKKKKDEPKKGVKVVAPKDVDEADELQRAASSATGGIPAFWLTAMKNNEVVEGMVMKRDEEALRALQNVTSEFIDGDATKGFVLKFTFGENAFFTDRVLTKTYKMDPEEDDHYACDDIIGCQINWTSPANKLTVVIKEKKQRHKSGKGVRVVQKEEKCPSFFHFFDPPKMPASDDEAEDEPDEEDDNVEDVLQMDYEAGQAFHEMLVPRAIYYYTGENISDMATQMMADGMGGDDEEEEEDEEEESEDEAPQQQIRGRGGAQAGGRGGAGGRGRGGDAPECKQQ